MGARFLRGVVCAAALLAAPMASAQQGDDAAGQRSMAFEPGLGDAAQERVPGGRLVAMAYGFVLLAIGGYVGFIARSAAKLELDVRELEDALARRPGGDDPR
jgi:hypothetical protein